MDQAYLEKTGLFYRLTVDLSENNLLLCSFCLNFGLNEPSEA